ncbi:Cingulin-like protein 1 [Bagarius yarrelli]|uniref:Cingulin-like protein 1 n=1 Tax=Bagarius yarrelli TaxID=175774 RepID=A0A556THU1_BAGYA|nr:Cingulin-like protein 1 [Bagarius yarrelli]
MQPEVSKCLPLMSSFHRGDGTYISHVSYKDHPRGAKQWPCGQTMLTSSFENTAQPLVGDRMDRLEDVIHVLRNHAVGRTNINLTNNMRSLIRLTQQVPVPMRSNCPVNGLMTNGLPTDVSVADPGEAAHLGTHSSAPASSSDLTNQDDSFRALAAGLLFSVSSGTLDVKTEPSDAEEFRPHQAQSRNLFQPLHSSRLSNSSSSGLHSDEESDIIVPQTPCSDHANSTSSIPEDENLSPEQKAEKEKERRLANNARERLRVRDINEAFKELGRMCQLHLKSDKPQTKLLILHQAVAVILSLEQQVRGSVVQWRTFHRLTMDLHGNSRFQGGYSYPASKKNEQIQPARDTRPGSFGVKVQVQSIQGQPYVVLNGQNKSPQPPVYPDVSYMEQQGQEYVSTMNGQGLSTQRPLMDYRSLKQTQMSPAEIHLSTNNPSSPLLNYQRHPALLRPYDPKSNNPQDFPNTINTKSNFDLNQFSTNTLPVCPSKVMVKRAKLPLPGTGRGQTEDNLDSEQLSSESVPCHQSHIICRLSVPYSGEDNGYSTTRVSRGRHRTQVDPQERKRSQSAGASSSGYSSRTSPVSAGGQGMAEGLAPAASFIGCVSQNDSLANPKTEENIYGTASYQGLGNELTSPQLGRFNSRIDRGNSARYLQQNGGHSSPEIEAQVTPDILKGQQLLEGKSNEDVTKLALFNYLKEGSGEGDEIIRQKVNRLFENIQMLRSCAIQNVEELSDSVSKVKELQERKEALESQVSQLKQHLEEEIMNSKRLSGASGNSSEELKRLQEKLRRSEQDQATLRHRFIDLEKDLQVSIELALQLKKERERSRAEAKKLQQQLSDLHDVLDNTKSTNLNERDTLMQELANLRTEFQDLQQVHEEREDMLSWKERELTAIKGALQDEISAHAKELEVLKEQHKEEDAAALAQNRWNVEAEQKRSHAQVQELSLAKEQLLGQVRSLETQITTLNNIIHQSKSQEKQLREHLDKLMSELTKLNQEHRQLKEKIKQEERQMEELRKSKKDLEQEKKRQDKDFEKLQDEIKCVLVDSERETQRLQDQVDEAREQSSKELAALHMQLHNTQTELDKHTRISQECQKKLSGLEAELARREAELEKTEQKCKQLEMRVQELQECNKTAQDDRDRQVKLMGSRVAQLQDALTEERCSGDTMIQRMEIVKEQVEQVRAELLQERAVRQDLECDKISLERQNKDLKSRLSHLEVSQRSSQEGLVNKLELRVQELEERLHDRERDNNLLEQANRKLERKMKEISMQVNDEQLLLRNQMDQLTLRLKALKRQLDEAEEEIERLESSKKKLQRDLDDQQEVNEQLHNQITSLKTELRLYLYTSGLKWC